MKKKKVTKKPKTVVSQRAMAQKRRQKAFLEAYAQCATITHAALAAKIGRQTHYNWIKKDSEYRKAFAEAQHEASDALISEARRRAIDGTEKPVYYKGEVCGTIREYSDSLLMFLIKGDQPEKYRERYEFSGGDKPIGVDLDPGRSKLPDDQLDRLIALGERLAASEGR